MASLKKTAFDFGITTNADLQVDGNATITGNLTVNGTQTVVNSTTTSVTDSLFELANSNTSSDTLDIGFYGNYDDGLSDGTGEFTGLFRDASDSTWKLFDGLEVEPTTTVNTSGTGYTLADLQVGDLTATTITATNSLTGSSITYPTTDGSAGQTIVTDGSGNLSFATVDGFISGTDKTTTSTFETTLDTFPIASYRSAKYHVSISDSTSGEYMFTELAIIHNGSDAYVTQYGLIFTGAAELASFGVDISSGNLRIRTTPASTNSTVFKFKKIFLEI